MIKAAAWWFNLDQGGFGVAPVMIHARSSTTHWAQTRSDHRVGSGFPCE